MWSIAGIYRVIDKINPYKHAHGVCKGQNEPIILSTTYLQGQIFEIKVYLKCCEWLSWHIYS
jgi:hypothetical protein